MADSRILSHGVMCDMPPNASMHALQAQTQKYQFYSNAWEHHVTFFELVNLTLYHHYAIPCVPQKSEPFNILQQQPQICSDLNKILHTQDDICSKHYYIVSYKSALTLMRYEFLNNIIHKS